MKRTFMVVLTLALTLANITPASLLAFPDAALKTRRNPPSNAGMLGLFRTRVSLTNPSDRQRLNRIGGIILEESANEVLVLVDDGQLEALTRLRFELQATDRLDTITGAASVDKAWLQSSLNPLFTKAGQLQALETQKERMAAQGADLIPVLETARADLRTAMHQLSTEQRAGIAVLSSVDDDGDGLTNTQEQWWCTNPMNPDSDGDGTTDGAEVQAAKDWLANRRASPPNTGKPFAGWPSQIAGCRDDDQDSVPDLAERWELGLNMNRESTDRDKFDDGQELFGLTYCPGSGGFCGYGALPRNEDWGVIFAEMPSWVRRPGNHPLVAAFPMPEIDVVPSSFRMQAVTTVTTDHTISSGTERSYSTAHTQGTSSSVADTQMWNDWVEVSHTEFSRVVATSFEPQARNQLELVSPHALNIVGALALSIAGNCIDDEIKGEKSSCRTLVENIGSGVRKLIESHAEFQRECISTAMAETSPWRRGMLLNTCYPSIPPYSKQSSSAQSCEAMPPMQVSVQSCSGLANGLAPIDTSGYAPLSGSGIALQNLVDGRGGTSSAPEILQECQ